MILDYTMSTGSGAAAATAPAVADEERMHINDACSLILACGGCANIRVRVEL